MTKRRATVRKTTSNRRPYEQLVIEDVRPSVDGATRSTWYELFVRSQTPDPARSGTLRDAEHRLDEIHRMGFDVVYPAPIHPIGHTNRAHEAMLRVPLDEIDVAPGGSYEVCDLLSGQRYTWSERNYVRLDPVAADPVHIFRVERASSGEAAR